MIPTEDFTYAALGSEKKLSREKNFQLSIEKNLSYEKKDPVRKSYPLKKVIL